MEETGNNVNREIQENEISTTPEPPEDEELAIPLPPDNQKQGSTWPAIKLLTYIAGIILAAFLTVSVVSFAWNQIASWQWQYGAKLTVVAVSLIALLLLTTWHRVEGNHYAELRILGWRSPFVFSKNGAGGLFPWWPWIFGGTMKCVSVVPFDLRVPVEFMTKDTLGENDPQKSNHNVWMKCVLYLKLRADPRIRDKNNRNTFLGNDLDVIIKNAKAKAMSKLGSLGGKIGANDFVEERMTVQDIIGCAFRMATPPHKHHNSETCEVVNCKHGEKISAHELIEFYKTHWSWVGRELGEEEVHEQDYSSFEFGTGTDVIEVSLEDVDFTDETKRAQEQAEIQQARANAGRNQIDFIKQLNDVLPDLPDVEKLDASQTVVQNVPTTIKKIRSSAPIAILENDGGFNPFGKTSGEEKRRGGKK